MGNPGQPALDAKNNGAVFSRHTGLALTCWAGQQMQPDGKTTGGLYSHDLLKPVTSFLSMATYSKANCAAR